MLDFIQTAIVTEDFRQPSFSIVALAFKTAKISGSQIKELKLAWKHKRASGKSSPAFRKAVRRRLDKEQIVHGVALHPRTRRCKWSTNLKMLSPSMPPWPNIMLLLMHEWLQRKHKTGILRCCFSGSESWCKYSTTTSAMQFAEMSALVKR